MAQEITSPAGPRLPWAGKLVSTDQAEQELSNLWQLSADNVRIGQNIRVRQSVLNLVLCASSIETAQRASAQLRDLSSTHVGRVVLIILDSSPNAAAAKDNVTTWVTLRSFPIISDIMRHSFEQITIRRTGAATRSAATIVQPLLKPDLPMYLWWVDDLPDDTTIFSRMLEISGRMIVDSSQFTNPEERMRTLSRLLQSSPESALSDINWGRITPWRELIAQFYDVPEYKPYVAGVDYVEIEHAVSPAGSQIEAGSVSPNPIRALLLAGWLKTSPDWDFVNEHTENAYDSTTGTYTWFMVRQAGPHISRSEIEHRTVKLTLSNTFESVVKQPGEADASIYIRPREQADLPPGTICLVRIFSHVNGERASFTIALENDADHVSTAVELSQGTRPQRTVRVASARKEHDLLHDELEITGHDHLYEETLHEVFELLNHQP